MKKKRIIILIWLVIFYVDVWNVLILKISLFFILFVNFKREKKKFEKVQKYKYKFKRKEYPSVSHTADSSPLFAKAKEGSLKRQ